MKFLLRNTVGIIIKFKAIDHYPNRLVLSVNNINHLYIAMIIDIYQQ